jgi:hypothetical protein
MNKCNIKDNTKGNRNDINNINNYQINNNDNRYDYIMRNLDDNIMRKSYIKNSSNYK